jgi:hypothetical protein
MNLRTSELNKLEKTPTYYMGVFCFVCGSIPGEPQCIVSDKHFALLENPSRAAMSAEVS